MEQMQRKSCQLLNEQLRFSADSSAQSLCCRFLFVYSTTRLRGLVADRFGYKATMD